MRSILIFILLFILPTHIFGQDYFTVDRHRNVQILESYDGGYLLLSDESAGNEPTHITKLNLIGDVLWEIALEPEFGALLSTTMEIDIENNIYIAGNSGRHDNTFGNSFTLKLNPCGELVWIHFYGYNGFWDIVTDLDISDEDFIHTIYVQQYGVQNQETGAIENAGKLRHAKLNLDGDTIRSNVWPVVTGVDEHSEIIATNDGGSLISMRTYHSYLGSPNYIRPTFHKVDANGETQWIKRVGIEDEILGHGYSAVELDNGNYACILIQSYTGISNYLPLFFAILSPDGELLDLHQISEDDISNNGEFHMLKRNENELIVTTAPATVDDIFNTYFRLYKLDNDGNVLASYDSETPYRGLNAFDICENGDILIALHKTSSDEPDNIHIYRFDGETLDPIPVPEEDNNEYDTLCPDGIAMSEYSFPTSEELGHSQLTISNGMVFQLFPNPIQNQFSLQWTAPQNRANETWTVACHDIFGKLIYSQEISSTDRSLEVNTTAWKKSIYFLNLSSANKLIYQQKIAK